MLHDSEADHRGCLSWHILFPGLFFSTGTLFNVAIDLYSLPPTLSAFDSQHISMPFSSSESGSSILVIS